MIDDWSLWNNSLTLAKKYHEGQVDKAGQPYIGHVERVGKNVFQYLCDPDYSGDDTIHFAHCCQAVGFLHDILEDTDCTVDVLRENGIPEDVIEGVISVTRKEDESYSDFVKRAAENNYGRWVKYFDLEDNLDIKRLKKITVDDINRINKYLKWHNYLEKKLYEQQTAI